jgi:NADH dehydrogenase
MTILVVGNNGLIRRAIIDTLYRGPHHVRLFAPDATAAASEWPAHVEPYASEFTATSALTEACRGCDVMTLLESDLGVSHDAMRHMVDAAATAEVARVLHVAPLQEDATEHIVQRFPRDWLVIRHSLVYGPGDPVVSRALVLMRSLPVVPLVGGTQRLQPLWYADLGDIVGAAIESPRIPWRQDIPVAGPESITLHDLYEHLALLIDRRPPRIAVPEFLQTYGSRVAELLHLPTDRLSTLLAGVADRTPETIPDGAAQNVSRIFGVRATLLDEGLTRLANELAEQVPGEGIGSIELKRFWTDIRGSAHDAISLMRLFKDRFNDMVPIPFGVEPVSPGERIVAGETLTAKLPLRGHVQVRVEEATDRQVTLVTLQGHPLSGIVRFRTEDVADGVRFEIMTCDQASNAADWVFLTAGGAHAQSANWHTVLQRVVDASGGSAEDAQQTTRKLSKEEAAALDPTFATLIAHRPAPETRTRAAG